MTLKDINERIKTQNTEFIITHHTPLADKVANHRSVYKTSLRPDQKKKEANFNTMLDGKSTLGLPSLKDDFKTWGKAHKEYYKKSMKLKKEFEKEKKRQKELGDAGNPDVPMEFAHFDTINKDKAQMTKSSALGMFDRVDTNIKNYEDTVGESLDAPVQEDATSTLEDVSQDLKDDTPMAIQKQDPFGGSAGTASQVAQSGGNREAEVSANGEITTGASVAESSLAQVNLIEPEPRQPIIIHSNEANPLKPSQIGRASGGGARPTPDGDVDVSKANGGKFQERNEKQRPSYADVVREPTEPFSPDDDEEQIPELRNYDSSNYERNPSSVPQVDVLVSRESVESGNDSLSSLTGVAKVEFERRAESMKVDKLKMSIISLHQLYDDVIPQFKSTQHQLEKQKALKSGNAKQLREHFVKMELLVKSYFSSLGGDVSIGVIISAQDYANHFSNAMMPTPMMPTPTMPTPEPRRTSNEEMELKTVQEVIREGQKESGKEGGGGRNAGVGRKDDIKLKPSFDEDGVSLDKDGHLTTARSTDQDKDESQDTWYNWFRYGGDGDGYGGDGSYYDDEKKPSIHSGLRRRMTEAPSSHFSNNEKWNKHEQSHITSLRGADPYNNNTTDRRILTRNGGINHRYSKGIKGKIINAIEPTLEAGYINKPTLHQEVRQPTYVRRPVITRNPSEFKING